MANRMSDHVVSAPESRPSREPPESFALFTDHVMTRLAYVVIAVESDVVLIGRSASVGWGTTAGLLLALCGLLVTALAIWAVSRVPRNSLVVGVDATGIDLGPSPGHLIPLVRSAQGSCRIAWANVCGLELIVRDATVTESGLTVRQRRLRVTTTDGRCVERDLPAQANLAALEQIARTYAEVAGPRAVAGERRSQQGRGGTGRYKGSS
jgi:hypothetical protein